MEDDISPDMELDAERELWTMIEELATHKGGLQERAIYTNKRLGFLEANHVPAALKSSLEELKSLAASANSMSEKDAEHFIQKVLSFYGRLRDSTS